MHFFIAIIVSFSSLVLASTVDNIHIVVKIRSIQEISKITGHPIVLEDKKLKEVISKLEPGDEVLLKGNIQNHPVVRDNKTDLNPTFHIYDIRPISLSRLGQIDKLIPDSNNTIFKAKEYGGPGSIPVSGEVATALTLTATILMMKDLSNQPVPQPAVRDSINSGLLFSAGAMATGLFIWKQLHQKKSSSKN